MDWKDLVQAVTACYRQTPSLPGEWKRQNKLTDVTLACGDNGNIYKVVFIIQKAVYPFGSITKHTIVIWLGNGP